MICDMKKKKPAWEEEDVMEGDRGDCEEACRVVIISRQERMGLSRLTLGRPLPSSE